VRQRRLPNWLCLAVLIAGLGTGYALHDASWAGSSALHALAALLVGMGLFALGMIGGGDAKFYAAMAGWFPLKLAIGLLGIVSAVGLVLLLAWLGWRRMTRTTAPVAQGDFAKFPYGVAIAAGAVATFAMPVLGWA
jgi:prepilin peptidase CpaA